MGKEHKAWVPVSLNPLPSGAGARDLCPWGQGWNQKQVPNGLCNVTPFYKYIKRQTSYCSIHSFIHSLKEIFIDHLLRQQL